MMVKALCLLPLLSCVTSLRVSSNEGEPVTATSANTTIIPKELCPTVAQTFLKKLDTSISAQDKAQFEDLFRTSTGPTILIVATSHMVCMTDNFLYQTRKHTNAQIVHVSLDAASHDACVNYFAPRTGAMNCFDFTKWLPVGLYQESKIEQGQGVEWGSCVYHFIVWAKPLLTKVASAVSPFGVLTMDTDQVMHDDLPSWLVKNANLEITMAMGSGEANTGTVWSNKTSLPILNDWIAKAGSKNEITLKRGKKADQYAYAVLLGNSTNHYFFKTQLIPLEIFGQGGKKGTFATHYNDCQHKIQKMTEDGVWHVEYPQCTQASR